MSKNRKITFSLIIGLAAGIFADGYLRFISLDEGNLLVHSAVFFGAALITFGAMYGLFHLWDIMAKKKK